MAKGKSNPKTVERVKGMTKAMRNEMERAEAEAAATEATARSAKEKKRGRRRGDASSDEDEGEGVNTENATSSATQHKHAKGNKVQIGGFGIGCRGTGNEKARRLKEEHDEKTRKKKATRARVAAERAARDEKEEKEKEEEEGDETWRIRNPTVNKRANRGKKEKKKKKEKDEEGFLGAGDGDDDDGDFAKIERTLLEDAATPENDEIDDEIASDADEDVFRLASLSGNAGGAVRAAAASAFSLLRGDDDDDDDDDANDDDDEDDDDANETTPAADDEDADSDSDDGSVTRRNLTDDDDTAIPGELIDSIETVESDGRGVAPTRENADIARDEAEDGAFGSASAPASVTNASSSSSDWETDEEKDDSAVPDPLVSLFDAHVSETVAENLEYMRRTHGFVVPYAGSLADPEGFVAYLRKKITRRRQCLFCRRRFATLEGVRGHMRDAGHVRVRFEPPAVFRGNPLFDEAIARANADGYRPEYSEFYDFGDAPDATTRRRSVSDDETNDDETKNETPVSAGLFDARGVGGGLELVLRDARGRTKQLGHRSFRRYYKQKFRNDYVARGCAADERARGGGGAGGAFGRAREEQTDQRHRDAVDALSSARELEGARGAVHHQGAVRGQRGASRGRAPLGRGRRREPLPHRREQAVFEGRAREGRGEPAQQAGRQNAGCARAGGAEQAEPGERLRRRVEVGNEEGVI